MDMAEESLDGRNQIQDILLQLQSSISDRDVLLSFLSAPLEAIGLLPPVFRRFTKHKLSSETKQLVKIDKHIHQIQIIILDRLALTWEKVLVEDDLAQILYQYFSPDVVFSATDTAVQVALYAYMSLSSAKVIQFSVEVLKRLGRHYPIDRLHSLVFSRSSPIPQAKKIALWDDVVKHVVSLPTKVANQSVTLRVPDELVFDHYMSSFCRRIEELIFSFDADASDDVLQSLQTVIMKLVNIGLFPITFSSTSQCSFPHAVLPFLRTRMADTSRHKEVYLRTWQESFALLPSTLLSKCLASFLGSLTGLPDDLDASEESRGVVKREAAVMSGIFGILGDMEDDKWDAVVALLLVEGQTISQGRILVCWASLCDQNSIPPRALSTLLIKITEIWTSPDHIKHSLLSYHQYMTAIFLLTITAITSTSTDLQSLAASPAFIESISNYINHLDPAVRRCGLLVAEIVAHKNGKDLNFGQWEGTGQGKEWARRMRDLMQSRDIDAEEAAPDVLRLELSTSEHTTGADVDEGGKGEDIGPSKPKPDKTPKLIYDSDDSLEGYASDRTSAASPTPSELDEIEKDPMTHVGAKKINKPVYLIDLASLITSSTKPDDPQNADRIEMALRCGEELIRRKQGFGLELEENAVNLVYVFLGINNNYDLEDFDQKRQDILTALVACCPEKAAPSLIDEFFKNQYSTEVRFAMLNALALGARELASLPVPHAERIASLESFPSKRLPEALHRKYIAYEGDGLGSNVRALVDNIGQLAIDSSRDSAENKLAPSVRERQLRIKRPQRVVEVPYGPSPTVQSKKYADLAAEYFVGPFIGKFWLFLREEKEREFRSSGQARGYHGSGTGLILNPMVLSSSLSMLLVLVHAARHSPAFLAILAPDSIELAMTLGTIPLSRDLEEKNLEAAVVNAALELVVVVMDASIDLDGGRSLCLENTTLFVGVSDWANKILGSLEDGIRLPGEGGVQEVKIRRSAAGVVLKADQIRSRWMQSMLTSF